MKRRHILFLAGLSVLIVTLFVMGWEFAFEDIVDSWLAGEPENETSHDRWEYVITATAAASMAWIVMAPVLFRLVFNHSHAERMRHEAYDMLERKVAERTATLETENAKRKRTEAALKESETRYRAIVEDQADPICRTTPDGTLTFVNETYCRYLGQTSEELVGQSFLRFVPETDLPQAREAMNKLGRDNPRVSTQHCLVNPDGTVRWQEWTVRALLGDDGEVTQFQAVGSDITDRKNAEISLRRLAAIVEFSADAITALTPEGIITDWNEAAESMYGYSADEAIGKSVEVIIPEERTEERRRIVEATARGEHVRQVETLGRRKDGSTFEISLSASSIEDAEGNIIGISGVHRDITKRRMAEKAIRDSESALQQRVAELEQAHRRLERQGADMARLAEDLRLARDQANDANDAKSQFLANMSHEIRTPMNGVLGMIGLLLQTEMTDQQREFAQTVDDSANALLTLINDILDISRLEEGKIELESTDFAFDQTIKQVLSLLDARTREKDIEIRAETSPDLPRWLRADSGRLRQILFNLVGNAIKFTRDGHITIAASHRMIDARSLELRCEVRDTGIGIAPEDGHKLFSRFSQADASTARRFGGSGLGLAICKQLVELMGGDIGVDSVPCEGSTFWFTIRCELGDASGAAEADIEAARPAASRALRILVAEDNHVNQKVVIALLAKLGHSVDVAANGLEAVEAVRNRPYDLLLMDIHMPEMDGITATRKIRELAGDGGRIPIVALSANAMQDDREKYLSVGMNDYVSKPIETAELYGAITRQCGDDATPQRLAGESPTRSVTSAKAQGELSGLVESLDDIVEP